MASHGTRTNQTDALQVLGRFALVATFLALGVSATLLASSLIDHGHGILGLSESLSLSILLPLIATTIAAGVGLLWKATSGELGSRDAMDPRPLRQKREIGSDEWFSVLTSAEREFYIAGHSMGLWCSASNKERFVSQLRRILASEGKVTLVMLGPSSPQLDPLHAATGTDYRDRIANSRCVLSELQESLDKRHRGRLRITMLEDNAPIPYMVVGNEKRLLTATYLARTDSEAMPCLELERTSEPGRAIYDDFHKLAEP